MFQETKLINQVKKRLPSPYLVLDFIGRELPAKTILKEIPVLVRQYQDLVDYLSFNFILEVIKMKNHIRIREYSQNWFKEESTIAHNAMVQVREDLKRIGGIVNTKVEQYFEEVETLREMNQ